MYTKKIAKWKFDKANWSNYVNKVILPVQFHDHNQDNCTIVNSILAACINNIPQTSTTISTKYCCFWWNDECKLALSNAKRHFRIVNNNHCPRNVIEFRRLDAIATRVLLDAKSSNWQEYLPGGGTPYLKVTSMFRLLDISP